MKVNVYVIKDVKLDRFNVPFYARDDREAAVIVLRANLPKSIYEDTKLFRVGSFDDAAIDQIPLAANSLEPVALLPYPNKEGVIM